MYAVSNPAGISEASRVGVIVLCATPQAAKLAVQMAKLMGEDPDELFADELAEEYA